ncbi:MAG: dipeptide ABC transporter ATP-binding protein [SAR324 cluster bacterium]|jgi:oligopeptide transport system ATP-binding protein|nr:dipeptide ABC transporter ATP-binding protein [SAR324 cluster bacterium]MDP7501608.1 dipeptide ABC transporter ATP-binding protein [SAR324 cluster bacterium]|tara:strand:- start:1117 stop:2100 length:984 start_codon:yes stop_codon:yes gene_type:complete
MKPEKKAVIQVKNLKKYFPITSGSVFQSQVGAVKAVDDISFNVYKGETLGLVGESGCGKSTCGRTILQLYRPTSGEVIFEGKDLSKLKKKELRKIRSRFQMVFQDPYSSLNPRATVNNIISEPLKIHHLCSSSEYSDRVSDLLKKVGLNPKFANRHPHEFSGGQRQRIAIARALALNPEFIVCDEPISALDVSIQAQIVNLLEELQEDLKLTYLFIAHDLSMVRHISRRVGVMYLGKLVELTDREQLYNNALHPYTKALLSAVPVHDPLLEEKRKRVILKGDVPSPANPPNGCNFNTRCPIAEKKCFEEEPAFKEVSSGTWCSCHFA